LLSNHECSENCTS